MFNRLRSLSLRAERSRVRVQLASEDCFVAKTAPRNDMRKWVALPISLVLLFAYVVPIARADDPPGAKLFTNYCSGCHGAAGKGGLAPAIGTEKYLSTHDDAVITLLTSDGVSGKGMPAWSKANGGTLTDSQIADIVAYMRSLIAPAIAAPAPTVVAAASEPIAYQQTKITMAQSTNASGATVLVATLLRYDGTPAVGASIAFWRPTILGPFDLGTVKTDKQGNATMVVLEQSEGARNILATFKGEPSLGSSEGLLTLQRPTVATSTNVNPRNVRLAVGEEPLLAPEGSLITPYPPLLPTTLFLLVVGCVWSAYAFVVYQVVGIWKDGKVKKRQNTFSLKR